MRCIAECPDCSHELTFGDSQEVECPGCHKCVQPALREEPTESAFSKQTVHCCLCGNKILIELKGGLIICSDKCREELEWRTTLSQMNKEYYAKPVHYPQ